MTEVNTYKTALKKSNSFEILRRQWERYNGVRSAVVTPGNLCIKYPVTENLQNLLFLYGKFSIRSINQTYRQRFADE